MTMHIRIEGGEEVMRALRGMAAADLSPAFGAYGTNVIGKVAPYPPKPPASKYNRTMQLFRGWYQSPTRKSVEVGNVTNYAPWVQGERTQVWYHARTGWKTLEPEAMKQSLDLRNDIIRIYESLVRIHGGF